MSYTNAYIEKIEKLEAEKKALLEACKEVISVGTILDNDTPKKPSVIYGHPSSEKWCKIFLMSRNAINLAEGK